MSLRRVNQILKDVSLAAGVRNPDPDSNGWVNPHLLRHTLAWNWKRVHGEDIEGLRNLLGHASVITTIELYGSLSVEDTRDRHDKLMDTLQNDWQSSISPLIRLSSRGRGSP